MVKWKRGEEKGGNKKEEKGGSRERERGRRGRTKERRLKME
jgi:hypothetical protein